MKLGPAILAVGGLGVAAEVLRRGVARSSDIRITPPQVSAAAAATLRNLDVDPCFGERSRARDYTALYVEQKNALKARFGQSLQKVCSKNGLGPCIPLPPKSIPTASAECTLAVVSQWRQAARSLASTSSARQAAELRELEQSLGAHELLARAFSFAKGGQAKLPGDLNGRIWSSIHRLSILLQGVLVHHGDAAVEARDELVRTVTDPSSYVAVAADAGGVVAIGAAQILGASAGKLLSSNLGALAVVAGAAYLAFKV